MPIFEFECKECDESFEELVRSSSSIEGVTCPDCGSTHVSKKISTFASKISGGSAFSFGSASSSAACSTGST